jgi:hypothetical protein
MHAVGLYLSLAVSPMKVQGTSDGKESSVRRDEPGQERRDAEAASLADLETAADRTA